LRVFGPSARLDTVTMTDPHDLNVPFQMNLRFRVPDFATLLKPKAKGLRPTIRFTLPKAGSGMIGGDQLSWASSMPVRKYAVDFHTTMAWHMVHEMSLPGGYKPVLVPDPLVRGAARLDVSSETKAGGGRVTNEAWFRLNDPVIPVSEYQGLRALLAATEEIERQHVMLKPTKE
jgi:hypothetical protein